MLRRERNNRLLAQVFIIGWLTVLLGTTIYSYFKPDRTTSFSENRKLIQFEEPTWENIQSGVWETQLESYHKDQFAFRDKWMRAYYGFLDMIGEHERNGYVRGDSNCILPVNNDYVTQSSIENASQYGEKQKAAVLKIAKAASEYGGHVIYLNVPSHQEMFAQYYPSGYESMETINTLRRKSIISKMKATGISVVETYDLMQEHKQEYIYFITDHHWTMKGAWYAYRALLEQISELEGKKIEYPEWDALEHIADERRMAGSYLRKWGDSKCINTDHMEYALPYEIPDFIRYDNGIESKRKLYMWNNTDYVALMGGDIGNTIIETGRDELPSVLYVGYSFGNALEAMSVYSFGRVESFDPRHTQESLCDYIAEHQPNYIVVVKDDICEVE